MPNLCRVGVLTECCEHAAPVYRESRGCSGKCPGKCHNRESDQYPDETKLPEKRECSSCSEACTAVAPHRKQTVDDDCSVISVGPTKAMQVPGSGYLPPPFGGHADLTKWPRENLPFPASDRPLRI